jgi:CubicO group peptidase (beta-lactamase class C family)
MNNLQNDAHQKMQPRRNEAREGRRRGFAQFPFQMFAFLSSCSSFLRGEPLRPECAWMNDAHQKMQPRRNEAREGRRRGFAQFPFQMFAFLSSCSSFLRGESLRLECAWMNDARQKMQPRRNEAREGRRGGFAQFPSHKLSFLSSCSSFLRGESLLLEGELVKAARIVCLCLLLCLPLAAQPVPDFSALDQLVQTELQRTHTPGAAIAVIQGDRVVYAKGYGSASAENATPVTPDTLFRLGSTTKMFTAAALVTLADRGKLKLNAPIGEAVPGLNPELARVTAHQLLSQSAGIRDFGAPFVSQDDEALGRNVRSWQEDVFFTKPGQIYSYSSPGYWLAGFVTEAVHGKPYAEALEELLFKPLGMHRTTLRPLAAATWPMAQGHAVENERAVVLRPLFNNVAMWPGGSIFSNVNELSRFVIALLNDGKLGGQRVLAPLVVAQLPARQMTLPGEEDAYYGYGLLSYEQRGVRLVGHGGASRGFGSIIQTAPASKFAFIILTNKSGETLGRVANRIMELGLTLKPESPASAPPASPLTAAEIADFSGVYEHAPQTWTVFSKDGKLWMKDEEGEHALTQTAARAFRYDQGELLFVANAAGQSEYLFMGLYAARKRGQQATAAPATSNEAEPLSVVNQLFARMRVKDTAGMSGLFTAEGRLVATDRRNGQPNRRVFDGPAFAKLIVETKGELKEFMYQPEVRLFGDLATVVGRYGFYVDERFSHCGTNAFHLMRTADGWKIVNAASTIEQERCEPEAKQLPPDKR